MRFQATRVSHLPAPAQGASTLSVGPLHDLEAYVNNTWAKSWITYILERLLSCSFSALGHTFVLPPVWAAPEPDKHPSQ